MLYIAITMTYFNTIVIDLLFITTTRIKY